MRGRAFTRYQKDRVRNKQTCAKRHGMFSNDIAKHCSCSMCDSSSKEYKEKLTKEDKKEMW